MPSYVALSLAKWTLDVLTRLVKADVRLHHAQYIQDNMAVIFTINHFTRLETVLLPYILYKNTGRTVMSLAAAELFQGRVGEFMESTGAISTKDPDRDKIIVRSLLEGRDPWMIFPEGAMIKDKKVLGPHGDFEVYSTGGRRPPHTGAAVLALRAEFYRHKIECIYNRTHREGLQEALDKFALKNPEDVLGRRTVIVPVNVSYFPIRAQENFLLRMANRMKEGLSPRAVDELSVEGTVLSEETDIDITLGEPIDVRDYLNAPQYAPLMACGLDDMHHLEQDPSSLFHDAARQLMHDYMAAIYGLTTINHDHIFAALVREQRSPRSSERQYRNRIYWCAREIQRLGRYRLHTLLDKHFDDILSEGPCPQFNDFLGLCLREGLLEAQPGEPEPVYRRKSLNAAEEPEFHGIRAAELTRVIANEIEPLHEVKAIIRNAARTSPATLARRIRKSLLQEDLFRFEQDYARYYDPEFSKGPDVGRPFLLRPWRIRGGVVLSHGYMAAPLEVRALAQFLRGKGYAVYGIRLPGHGTAPENLAEARWEEWYDAYNRGYAIIRSLATDVYLGGFSAGGCLALMAAARKGLKPRAVFSISAPRKLQNYSVRLAPSIVNLSTLMKKMGANWTQWDYVENHPENAHINYTRNPLAGVRQLMRLIEATEDELPNVQIPALILQGDQDPIVNPASGQLIFDKLGTPLKELTLFHRDRHGIVNGPGSKDVFHRVHHFLQHAEAIPPAEPEQSPTTLP